MTARIVLIGLMSIAVFPAGSQGAEKTAFEAASVKISKLDEVGSEGSRRESIEHTPVTLTMRNVSLRSAILWGYALKAYQVSGPTWLMAEDERFDIAAKASAPASVEQLQTMLQVLLAERFGLRTHREQKEMPVYELVAMHPQNLREVRDDEPAEMQLSNGSLNFRHASMGDLAKALDVMRRVIDRPVVDRTGLTSKYDFSLKLGDTDRQIRAAMVQGDGPSVFRLLQEQLGLKLQPQKMPMDVLVVDHAEKAPTAN